MNDIDRFLAGFEKFQAKYFQEEDGTFARLSQGQEPSTLVISCCDSRVDPAMLTDADPGDLFVVRNIANLVPPYRHEAEAPGIRSALEFAVLSLNVEHIIVLGHSKCGGIQALMNLGDPSQSHLEFTDAWVSVAIRAREQVLEDLPNEPSEVQARACERAAIVVSLENLMSFPWIRERVDKAALSLHGWYFDIDTGALLDYSSGTGTFRSLVPVPVSN